MCDSELWASCIGGAAQQESYLKIIEASGFSVKQVRRNPYEFLSDGAREATETYGVKSLSILASRT